MEFFLNFFLTSGLKRALSTFGLGQRTRADNIKRIANKVIRRILAWPWRWWGNDPLNSTLACIIRGLFLCVVWMSHMVVM